MVEYRSYPNGGGCTITGEEEVHCVPKYTDSWLLLVSKLEELKSAFRNVPVYSGRMYDVKNPAYRWWKFWEPKTLVEFRFTSHPKDEWSQMGHA